jgi:hypothetical protein
MCIRAFGGTLYYVQTYMFSLRSKESVQRVSGTDVRPIFNGVDCIPSTTEEDLHS